MMKYKYILWDWNGTLLDDLEASLRAVNDLLAVYGKSPLDLATYYSYIDTPIYKFYEHIFDLDVITMEMIKILYGKLYDKYDGITNLADGAAETVAELKKMGVKQYILSAANENDLKKQAKKLNVYDYFEKIDAAKDYDAGSKVDRAKALMKNEGIPSCECVMVGDTLHDLETAASVGIECILYSKGHTDKGTLDKTGYPVCDHFNEILKLITE